MHSFLYFSYIVLRKWTKLDFGHFNTYIPFTTSVILSISTPSKALSVSRASYLIMLPFQPRLDHCCYHFRLECPGCFHTLFIIDLSQRILSLKYFLLYFNNDLCAFTLYRTEQAMRFLSWYFFDISVDSHCINFFFQFSMSVHCLFIHSALGFLFLFFIIFFTLI